MSKKIRILREVFDELYRQIRNKDKGDRGAKDSESYFYGFNKYKKITHEKTLKNILASDTRIQNYIIKYYGITFSPDEKSDKRQKVFEKLNGKYLYDRKQDFHSKNKNQVLFSGIYSKIYFIYVDCEDIADFLEKNSFSQEVKEFQYELIHSQGNDNYISNLAFDFQCFYFNSTSETVQSFFLSVDHLNNYYARQVGFHSTEERRNIRDYTVNNKNSVFFGEGIQNENFLHFNLTPEGDNKRFMTITIYIGGLEIDSDNVRFLRGMLSTMSIYGYLFSSEIFLVKKTRNEDYKINELTIKRYLLLERRAYIIPSDPILELPDLTTNQYFINEIKHMVGSWRIWSITRGGSIYQSKFQINSDYSATLYTNDIDSEGQKCIIELSTGGFGGLSLCVSAYQKKKNEIRNFAIIKVPYSSSEITITTGLFSGIGVENRMYNIGVIALLKDSSNFSSCFIYQDEIQDHITDASIRVLNNKLSNMQKRYEKNRLIFLEENFSGHEKKWSPTRE